MKVKKIYTIGVNEAVLTFKIGKVSVIATFKNGNINAPLKIPARCITEDPLAQYAIENDARFGKSILLENAYYEDGTKATIKNGRIVSTTQGIINPQENNSTIPMDNDDLKQDNNQHLNESKIIEEVVDINGVVEHLKALGSKGNQLMSLKSILNQCERFKIDFPNVVALKEDPKTE